MEPHFFLPPVVPSGTDEFDELPASAENVKVFTNSAARNAGARLRLLARASDAPSGVVFRSPPIQGEM